MVIIIVFTSLPVNVFGEGTLAFDLVTYDDIEESNIEFDELSTEDLDIINEVIENAISEENKEDPNFNEAEFVEDVEAFLEGNAEHFLVEEEESEKEGIFAALESFFFIKVNAAVKKGKISISNKVVAVGVNAVVSLAIGEATTYALKTIVLKKELHM